LEEDDKSDLENETESILTPPDIEQEEGELRTRPQDGAIKLQDGTISKKIIDTWTLNTRKASRK
jgi:hypothetical protein